MNVFVIDLGSEFLKMSLFKTQVENKQLVNYQLLYSKVVKNPGSEQLLILAISRVYKDLQKLIDKVIILPERMAVATDVFVVENNLTKQKVLEDTRKAFAKKDKKQSVYQSFFIQHYNLSENYVDIIMNSLAVSEYQKILHIAKDLRMTNISVFNPNALSHYMSPDYSGIVCDIGCKQMTLTYLRAGMVKNIKTVNIELDDLNQLIINSNIPDLNIDITNVYSLKHSMELLSIKNQSEAIFSKIDRIAKEVSSFILEEGLTEDTPVKLTGGYANMEKESDFFEIGREVECKLPTKLLNVSNVPNPLAPYLYNSIASIEAFFHESRCDLLTDSDKLAILSNNLYTFSRKCNWLIGVAVLAFGINLGASYVTQYMLTNEYQQYAQNNQSELDSIKTGYSDICKKCDDLIMKAKMPKNNYKLSKNIALLSAIKPSNINIDHMDYSNGTENYCVVTTDLEQCVVFANKLKDYFDSVRVQPPSLLQKGDKAIYKVTIVCEGFKGGM